MAQRQQSGDIARPLEEVFAFAANPANDARWGSDLVEVTQLSPGPLGVGTRFRYTARFAGRQFELVRRGHRIPAQPPAGGQDRLRPPAVGGARTFEAIPGGTRITFSGGGRAAASSALTEPLLLHAAQRSLRADLATLKQLLEGQPQA